MNRLFKKIGKYILYLFGVIIAFLLVVLLVIGINSSGKPEPVVDAAKDPLPHSIALIKDTVINGAVQRLTIRGHDQSNPVLLRVHGGPGKVEPPQAYRFNKTDLEEYFTVCYWDQRGVGPAFDGNVSEQSYTIEQIVKDGLIVTEYLRETLSQDKIYIEGTSTGTVIASFMVREKPQYYQAYIGVAQMADGIENEKLSYDFVLSEAVKRRDMLAMMELADIGPPPYETVEKGNEAVQIERFYADKYMPKSPTDMSSMDVMKLIFLYDGWSMSYKFHLVSNGMYSPSTPILWPQFAEIDMFNEMIDWPSLYIYYMGSTNHNAEFSLSKMYFDSLKAPHKEFFPFQNTGHAIHYDRPEKYSEIYLKNIYMDQAADKGDL